MTKISFAAAVLTTACTILSAEEQDRMGVGVGISDNSVTLRLPVQVEKAMRIEPEFALRYTSQENNKATHFTIGTGFYAIEKPSLKIDLYYGGKALFEYNSLDNGVSNTSSSRIILGGVFGAEYQLDPNFTIGCEAGLYLGFLDYTSVNTKGEALLRYYF